MNPSINESAVKDIRGYFGSSGSGKTHKIKEDIKSESRVLVFDPEGSFSAADGFTVTTSRREFFERARNSGPLKLCFGAGGVDNFKWFANTVFALADARRPSVLVVDELGGVTGSGKAQGGWYDLISRGRKYEVKIRAGAQRCSEIDKTLMGNKNGLFIGYQERAGDIEYLARETGIDVDTIAALRGEPYYDHILYGGRDNWKLVKK
jgi:hypothetical protein